MENKNSKLLIIYKGHQFYFYKNKDEKLFKLNIDTISFDNFKPKNKIQIEYNNSNTAPIKNIANSVNVRINKKSFEKLINKNNNNNIIDKKTGSDIYKSNKDEILINNNNINLINQNYFNNINNEENIPIRRLKSNEINNQYFNFDNNSINDSDLIRKSAKSSVYIEEIDEEEIPEYDYIYEKIINANMD